MLFRSRYFLQSTFYLFCITFWITSRRVLLLISAIDTSNGEVNKLLTKTFFEIEGKKRL